MQACGTKLPVPALGACLLIGSFILFVFRVAIVFGLCSASIVPDAIIVILAAAAIGYVPSVTICQLCRRRDAHPRQKLEEIPGKNTSFKEHNGSSGVQCHPL